MKQLNIGIDIGGMKIAVGAINDEETYPRSYRVPDRIRPRDARKVRIARRLRGETSATLKWIAEQLHLEARCQPTAPHGTAT